MKLVSKFFPYFLVSVLTAAGTVAMYHYYFYGQQWDGMQTARTKLVRDYELALSEKLNKSISVSAPTDFSDAAERAREAVVAVRSSERFAGQTGFATGSGVIFTSDGYIATNFHVVKDASDVRITLNNQKTYNARVVAGDESTDLALLKIEAENLPHLQFGNSDSLRVGEWVMAIGNPFTLQSTVTAGIVSAKARNINILERQGIESFIQTDAVVNPGSSGGALINTKGLVVGINTAIMSQTGNYEGYSFAIPSNIARKVLLDLIEYGVVQRGWLGIEIGNVDQKLAEAAGLPEVAGIFVASVTAKGGAHDAGIRNGDIIISIQNVKVNTVPEFMEQIARYRPGDEIQLIYYRNKKLNTAKAVLRNQLNTTGFVAAYKDKILQDIGIEVRALDEYEQKIVSGKGVYVISVRKNSPAGQSRMEPGYIIKSANNTIVDDPRSLVNLLAALRGKSVIIDGFYMNYPGEYPYTFVVPD
ncbi:MAG: trypsin-like peptidase domain-containing protein [Saprospiraceae bacterium]|nr:trypsin-like peptidase domain-containing protein [Saprospiraceae bacterium]